MKGKLLLIYLLVFTVVSVSYWLKLTDIIENAAFDFFYQSTTNRARPDIFVIGIDDESIKELGQWPWSRALMGEMIHVLNTGAKPAVIAIDLIYDTESDKNADQYFAEVVKNAGNVVLASQFLFGTSIESALENETISQGYQNAFIPKKIIEPIPILNEAAVTGFVNAILDKNDHILRKALLNISFDGREYFSFSYEIYKKYMLFHNYPLSEKKPQLDKLNQFLIEFSVRPYGYYGNLNGGYSFSKVLYGKIPSEEFDGAIVIIGPYSASFQDRLYTSNSRAAPMHGVEVQANIVQSLIESKFIYQPPSFIYYFLFLILLLLIYFYNRLFDKNSFLFLIIVCICIISLSLILYYTSSIYIDFTTLVILAVTLYIVTLAYKYIAVTSERRRIKNIFGKYVAPEVVTELLKKEEESLKLGGQLKQVAVLFVDVRGFSSISEKTAPISVVEILNEYLSLTSSCIFKYHGTLDKFMGDAAMAFYNAPLPLEDYAMCAVKSALMMKERAVDLEKSILQNYDVKLAFGIGINCGQAIVGNIGTMERLDYTVIGDTVNIASRLENNARPGQILISENVYSMLRERIHVTEIGEIPLKGKENKLMVYQLDGLRIDKELFN